ncbi:MAG: succinate dehydrogenase assembly factor 4 [Terricaulis sp.]
MTDETQPPRKLTPEAQRALAEAEQRRAAAEGEAKAKEVGGPAGPEPTRYGDWERKGIASDF